MRARWIHGGVYLLYLALAMLITAPLVTQLGAVFIGAPESDAYEYARHIWWYGYALQNGLPVFAHPYLAYPDGIGGAWLWAIPLQSFPAVLFDVFLPLPMAFNVSALLRLALNGWSLYFLCWRLFNGTHTGTPSAPPDVARGAALLAGAVFMAYPTVQGQLFGAHVGIIALWGAPLYLDGLFSLAHRPTWRDYLRTALAFIVSLLGSTLLLVYVLFPLTLAFALWMLAARRWDALRRALWAVLLGGVGAAPFVIPAVYEQLTAESAIRAEGSVRYSADLLTLVSPSFFHPLWGRLEHPARVLGTNLVEGYGYVGVITALLIGVGLWRAPQSRRWLWLFGVAWVFSLGALLKINDTPATLLIDGHATFIPLPYALLQTLPILDQTRTPARFLLSVGMAAAVMAGYGALSLRHVGRRVRWALLGGLCLLILVDYQLGWRGNLPHFPTQTAHIPAQLGALADEGHIRAVFNIPHDNLIAAKEAMYLQTAHQKPILAGFVSRETPVSFAKRELLQRTLDPELLQQAGADVVIVLKAYDPALRDHAAAALGAPRYEDARYAVFDVR